MHSAKASRRSSSARSTSANTAVKADGRRSVASVSMMMATSQATRNSFTVASTALTVMANQLWSRPSTSIP